MLTSFSTPEVTTVGYLGGDLLVLTNTPHIYYHAQSVPLEVSTSYEQKF
jgi:hypothetical protein